MKKKILVGLLLVATVVGLAFAGHYCTKCNSTGKVACSNCKYSVKGPGHIYCGRCLGTGRETNYSTWQQSTCTTCGGKGWTECSHCSGTGKQDCSACNGEGYLYDDDDKTTIYYYEQWNY